MALDKKSIERLGYPYMACMADKLMLQSLSDKTMNCQSDLLVMVEGLVFDLVSPGPVLKTLE